MSTHNEDNGAERDGTLPRSRIAMVRGRERGLAHPGTLEAKVSEALIEGGTERVDEETRFVLESLEDQGIHDAAKLNELLSQLRAGVSPYHVLGQYPINGNAQWRLDVPRDVMPPGSITPIMVERAQQLAGQIDDGIVIDFGCGTGVLGFAALLATPNVRGVFIDVSTAACEAASQNAVLLGLGDRVQVIQNDTLDGCVPWTEARLVVANLPHTPSAKVSSLPKRYGVHTPPIAVDGGADGLEIVRRAIGILERRAVGGTTVLLQTPPARVSEVRQLFDVRLWEWDAQDSSSSTRPFVIGTRHT